MELLQQVFADLISGESALLVFRPADLRVLHGLHIEPDQFLGQVGDGGQGEEAADYRQGGVHPVLEAGGQPPHRARAVVEPGSPVAQVGAPATAAEIRPLFEALADRGPPMAEFPKPKGMTDRSSHPRKGDAGGFRARVEGEQEGLKGPLGAFLEPDGEGVEANHHRLLALEQDAGPGRGGRHEGPPALVQDKNTSVTACRLGLGLRFGP